MSILTIDDISETIKIRSKGRAKLLSTTYINNEEPLLVQCQCGEVFERTYASIRRSKLMCKECQKKVVRNQKYTLEDIKKIIAEHGCEYVSGEYVNSYSKLLVKCSCGEIFEKPMRKFNEGQTQCPKCGMKKRKYPKMKKPLKEKPKVKVEVQEKQKETPRQKKKVIKEKKPKKRKPDRHAEIGEIIREDLEPWKTKIKRKYGRKCPISGESGDNVVVHHLVSLNTIFKEECKKHNIKCYMSDVVNYDERPECAKLIKYVVQRHDMNMGVLVSKDIHKLFHKEYGYGGNTKQQFDDFLHKHYGMSLDDLNIH